MYLSDIAYNPLFLYSLRTEPIYGNTLDVRRCIMGQTGCRFALLLISMLAIRPCQPLMPQAHQIFK